MARKRTPCFGAGSYGQYPRKSMMQGNTATCG
jgi:hypothetical protein